MSADAPASASPSAPRGRRWWRHAGILIASLTIAVLALPWLLPPTRVADLALGQLGRTLALDIVRGGDADYRLRGGPMLLVRDVVVRVPSASHSAPAAHALLHADRVYVALPWRTILSRGGDLTLTRIELDRPIVDVPALQQWLATRPPGESRIPTLSEGLRIRDGGLHNPPWRIEDIAVDLARLAPDARVDARLHGRYVDAPTRIPFDLAVAMNRPGNGAGVAVVGSIDIQRDSWRMPAQATLSGPLLFGDDDVRIHPARLGLQATFVSGDSSTPFALGLHGPVRFDAGTWTLAPVGVVLQGTQMIPELQSRGAIALGRRLVVQLDGAMQRWPEAWPALPPPLSSSAAPFAFALEYSDAADFSGPIRLRLQRDRTDFDGRFRLADIQDWIAGIEHGTPLPPLQGRIETPRVEISGARLEGVVVEFEDAGLDDGSHPGSPHPGSTAPDGDGRARINAPGDPAQGDPNAGNTMP